MNESTQPVEVEAGPEKIPPLSPSVDLPASAIKIIIGKFLKYSFYLLVILIGIDLLLLAAGFASSDYATVSSFSNISSMLMYPIGILAGLCLSVYTSRINTFIRKLELSNNSVPRKNTHLAIILPVSIIVTIIISYASGGNYLIGLAFLIGLPIFGYISWHRHGRSYAGWQKILLYGFAAIIGLLPGAIAAFIIAVVLSDRACSLSSSKCY